MIENISLLLTTVAAISAVFSCRISSGALDFQKRLARNQNNLMELGSIITKAKTLDSWLSDSSGCTDGQFESMDYILEEIKSELQQLDKSLVHECLDGNVPASVNVLAGQLGCKDYYLTKVISSLETERNNIFK